MIRWNPATGDENLTALCQCCRLSRWQSRAEREAPGRTLPGPWVGPRPVFAPPNDNVLRLAGTRITEPITCPACSAVYMVGDDGALFQISPPNRPLAQRPPTLRSGMRVRVTGTRETPNLMFGLVDKLVEIGGIHDWLLTRSDPKLESMREMLQLAKRTSAECLALIRFDGRTNETTIAVGSRNGWLSSTGEPLTITPLDDPEAKRG